MSSMERCWAQLRWNTPSAALPLPPAQCLRCRGSNAEHSQVLQWPLAPVRHPCTRQVSYARMCHASERCLGSLLPPSVLPSPPPIPFFPSSRFPSSDVLHSLLPRGRGCRRNASNRFRRVMCLVLTCFVCVGLHVMRVPAYSNGWVRGGRGSLRHVHVVSPSPPLQSADISSDWCWCTCMAWTSLLACRGHSGELVWQNMDLLTGMQPVLFPFWCLPECSAMWLTASACLSLTCINKDSGVK